MAVNSAPAISPRSGAVSLRLAKMYLERTRCMGRSVSFGGAFVARVGPAEPLARARVNANRVHQSEMTAPGDFVTPRLECFDNFVRERFLEQKGVRQPLVMEPRRVDGRLRLHAQSHPVQNAQQRHGNNCGSPGRAGDEAQLAV